MYEYCPGVCCRTSTVRTTCLLLLPVVLLQSLSSRSDRHRYADRIVCTRWVDFPRGTLRFVEVEKLMYIGLCLN